MFRVGALLSGFVAAFAHATALSTDRISRLEVAQDVTVFHGPEATRRSGESIPAQLNVAFSAFDERFEFNLNHAPFIADGTDVASFVNGEGEVVAEIPLVSHSYYSYTENGMASLTYHSESMFHMVFVHDGEVYTVDPVERHVDDSTAETARRLLASESGMVVYRGADVVDQGSTCGVVSHSETGEQLVRTEATPSSRSLLVERWTNCFSGDDQGRTMKVGMAADAGFYRLYNSDMDDVLLVLEEYIADSNIIYWEQVGVFLQMGTTIVKTSDGGESWNTPCPDSINTQLDNLRAWSGSSSRPAGTEGVWHLMTNCWPPPGTVGLAWVGVLCSGGGYDTGVSSYTGGSTWTVVAHELGHNFGAGHSFEEGQGTTGGIMDYGDGKLDGEYQFNSKYRKSEVCSEIASSTQCIPLFEPECGNGIIEPGEACDDESACCGNNCQLADGALCSGVNDPCCVNCIFSPVTTQCGGDDQHFCLNGDCVTSEICYWTNAYCGTNEDNACLVRCRDSSSGICYDATAFGLDNKMPTGATCSNDPYSTCSASGVCEVTPIASYWAADPWGECSEPCGEGTRTRNVYCFDPSTSTQVDDSDCSGLEKPAESETCDLGPCAQWEITYGECIPVTEGATCGDGTRTITAVCVGSSGTLPDSECDGTLPESEPCNVGDCVIQWVSGPWRECSVTCGTGTQTRTVLCNYQTAYDRCDPDDMPASQRSCTGETLNCAFAWEATDTWGDCQGECGTGVMYREYVCVDTTTGLAFDDDFCSGSTPVESAECELTPCDNQGQYVWMNTGFTDCETDDGSNCGTGTYRRTYVCIDTTLGGAEVSDSLCAASQKPDSLPEACSMGTSCPSYSYTTSSWTSCPVDCGGAEQTRDVYCVDLSSGVQVSDSNCKGQNKPRSKQTCNAHQCPDYIWLISDWDTCSADCDGGSQTRHVECINQYTWQTASASACVEDGEGEAPVSSQECNTQACESHNWHASDWSDCDVKCGGGLRHRAVYCFNEDQAVVDESYCDPSLKPSEEGVCNDFQCPSFTWHVRNSGSCSVSCGGGSLDRDVWCESVNNRVVEEMMCLSELHSGRKPYDEASCSVSECSTDYCQCSDWSDWSECICDHQLRYSTRTCEDIDGFSDCDALGYSSVQYKACDCSIPEGSYTYSVKTTIPYSTITTGWASWIADQQERLRWVLSRSVWGAKDYDVTIYDVKNTGSGTEISFYSTWEALNLNTVSLAGDATASIPAAASRSVWEVVRLFEAVPAYLQTLVLYAADGDESNFVHSSEIRLAFSMLEADAQQAAFNGYKIDSGSDDSLSDGEIAGIVVGTLVGVGGLAGAAVFVKKRRDEGGRLLPNMSDLSAPRLNLPFKTNRSEQPQQEFAQY